MLEGAVGSLIVLVAALLLALLAFGLRSRRAPDAALREQDAVSRALGQLQAELARVGRSQEDLRHDVQRGREASLLQLADATQGIRDELALAQRALAEVRALEQARARQAEQAAGSLRRLEAVVAGSSSRGAAGENILARALAQLPPDLIEHNVAFGSRVVEYALRLPGGRWLPIDSKWTSVSSLERLAGRDGDGAGDAQERKRLTDQVARELRTRVREMAKYVDPERTVGLGIVAVPDAVQQAAPEAQAEGYRDGVLVVPYSLALPYLLATYRLVLRFGASLDGDRLAERVRALEESLRQIGEEVEGRLSRALVQAQNARDAVRGQLATAQHTTAALLRETEAETAVLAAAGGHVDGEGAS